jgi:hypothetical protein
MKFSEALTEYRFAGGNLLPSIEISTGMNGNSFSFFCLPFRSKMGSSKYLVNQYLQVSVFLDTTFAAAIVVKFIVVIPSTGERNPFVYRMKVSYQSFISRNAESRKLI